AVLWKRLAEASNDPRLIAHAIAGIIRADRWFTLPGVIVILFTGFGLAHVGEYSVFGTSWIWMGLALFAASAVVAMLFVSPAQRRMLAAARAPQFDATAYARASATWTWSGILATVLPIAA